MFPRFKASQPPGFPRFETRNESIWILLSSDRFKIQSWQTSLASKIQIQEWIYEVSVLLQTILITIKILRFREIEGNQTSKIWPISPRLESKNESIAIQPDWHCLEASQAVSLRRQPAPQTSRIKGQECAAMSSSQVEQHETSQGE